MKIIFAVIILLICTSCSEQVDFSTPAQAHIDKYSEDLKKCIERKLSKDTNITKDKTEKVLGESLVAKPHDQLSFGINENDIVLGDPNSKIVLVEYFAPTCPHCAYYKKEIFPKIKKKYVDNNKIAYVVREFIGNKQDLDASILGRCSEKQDDFFKFANILLQQQDSWAFSSKYREILTNIGQLGGISPEQYSICLADNELVEILIANTKLAFKSPKFIGTPAFFINGEQYTNPYSFEELSKAIDKVIKVHDQ